MGIGWPAAVEREIPLIGRRISYLAIGCAKKVSPAPLLKPGKRLHSLSNRYSSYKCSTRLP